MEINKEIDSSWLEVLNGEFKKDYFIDIKNKLIEDIEKLLPFCGRLFITLTEKKFLFDVTDICQLEEFIDWYSFLTTQSLGICSESLIF